MVVDSDYRGEVIVALHNDSETSQVIEPYSRIAQLVIIPIPEVEIEKVEQLEETERGEGGFGSTGTTTFKSNKNKNKWVINCDGYYPTCPRCGSEPPPETIDFTNKHLPEYCPFCGLKLNPP